MNLFESLSQKDLKLLESKGYKIENKEYSQEDLKDILLDIEGDIMICSSKSNDMNKVSSKYSNIITTLERGVYILK